ncbi:MAG: EscN/YscN/HrcN family type III secretion system ATPase, partial [Armatimonadota bacterium]
RSTLDGHVVLSRDLAHKNHYPSIDVLASVSRLMPDVASADHLAAAATLRDVLATYRSAEDLINIGAYVQGTNPKIDYAVSRIDKVNSFLKQQVSEPAPYGDTVNRLKALFAETR